MEADAGDLFSRHAESVCRYFCRMTGNADLARDLAQEVFLRVVRGLHRYEARGREAAWVFRIAQSVLAANYRRKGRPEEVTLSETDAPTYERDHLLAIGFEEALALLSTTDRHVWLLREQGGLAYEEIAQACGLTKAAVRDRLSRAREQLRLVLARRLTTESPD